MQVRASYCRNAGRKRERRERRRERVVVWVFCVYEHIYAYIYIYYLHVYVHEGPLCVHYQSNVESLHFFLSFFTFYPHYRARLQSDYAPYHVDLSLFTLYRCIGEYRAIHCPPDICSYAPLRLASFDCASNTVLRPNQECGRVKFSITEGIGKSF